MPNPKYQTTGGVSRSIGPVITSASGNGGVGSPILGYQPQGGATTGFGTIGQRNGYLYYWPDIENLTGTIPQTDLEAQDISVLPSESLIIVVTGIDGEETHWRRMPDSSSPVTDLDLGIIVPLNYDSGTRPWVLQQELTGGGDGGGTSMSSSITQTAHGLSPGNAVRYTGSAYVAAKADTSANAEVAGIVSSVASANDFTLLTGGKITGLSGLTPGEVYFLSDLTAGTLTPTEPVAVGAVSKPLLIADSTTSAYFYNFRGKINPTGAYPLWMTVKDYGATGDGVTDDSVAIQNALDVGGNIFFPPGTYLISQVLYVSSNTVLVGDGRSVIKCTEPFYRLHFADGTEWYRVMIANEHWLDDSKIDTGIVYERLNFDATAWGVNGASIYSRNVTNLRVRNCTFKYGGDAVMHMGCSNVLIEGCTANNLHVAGFDFWESCEDCTVANCITYNCVFCCQFNSESTVRYGQYEVYTGTSKNLTAIGNRAYVSGYDYCAGVTAWPINLVVPCQMYNVQILNNYIKMPTWNPSAGIYAKGIRGFLISGNTIENVNSTGTGMAGIMVLADDAMLAENGRIVSNHFENCNIPGSRLISLSANNSFIGGNTKRNCTALNDVYSSNSSNSMGVANPVTGGVNW
jgi:Pectate lyase superfamily protein